VQERNCIVDCWVIPRENRGGCTLRYAFYRLLVQGLRRIQGTLALNSISVGGLRPERRQFFSGEPVFKVDGSYYHIPLQGYSRDVDTVYGAFFWRYDDNDQKNVYLSGNERIWDTSSLWGAS